MHYKTSVAFANARLVTVVILPLLNPTAPNPRRTNGRLPSDFVDGSVLTIPRVLAVGIVQCGGFGGIPG